MKREQVAKKIIATLTRENPMVNCGCCELAFQIRRADLFYLDELTDAAQKQLSIWKDEIRAGHRELTKRRNSIMQTSEVGARSVNLGFVLERLAPMLPTFPLNKNDCRSLGEPIDLLIFDGLAKRGRVDRVIFADIKTGNARLSDRQKAVRSVIEKKRLQFEVV